MNNKADVIRHLDRVLSFLARTDLTPKEKKRFLKIENDKLNPIKLTPTELDEYFLREYVIDIIYY